MRKKDRKDETVFKSLDYICRGSQRNSASKKSEENTMKIKRKILGVIAVLLVAALMLLSGCAASMNYRSPGDGAAGEGKGGVYYDTLGGGESGRGIRLSSSSSGGDSSSSGGSTNGNGQSNAPKP